MDAILIVAPFRMVSVKWAWFWNVSIRIQSSIVTGVVENKVVEIMIDSGSSISLVRGNLITSHKPNAAPQGLQLVSVAGEPISVLRQITLPI